MSNYYVYRHFKLNTNDVFYIGMGKEKNFRRSRSKRYRNNHWHNTVNKYGYSIEILAIDLSESEAIELEVFLIKEYGRRDLGTGCLINLTDGGEGVFNPSKESLESRSGGNSWKSKRVKNMDTGDIYTSLVECCSADNLNYGSMKNRLRGVTKNKTPYTYINELDEPTSKFNQDMTPTKQFCTNGKQCISILDGTIYECIREASEAIGIERSILKNDIYGKRYKYNIMYLEDYNEK